MAQIFNKKQKAAAVKALASEFGYPDLKAIPGDPLVHVMPNETVEQQFGKIVEIAVKAASKAK